MVGRLMPDEELALRFVSRPLSPKQHVQYRHGRHDRPRLNDLVLRVDTVQMAASYKDRPWGASPAPAVFTVECGRVGSDPRNSDDKWKRRQQKRSSSIGEIFQRG